MESYPTKDEILAEPLISEETNFPESALEIAYKYKKIWLTAKRNNDNLHFVLFGFLRELANAYQKPELRIGVSTHYFYVEPENFIGLGPKPSIISALHEFGHHLYGSSELKACRFSVHLFRTVWPKAYERLRWDGHMLKA